MVRTVAKAISIVLIAASVATSAENLSAQPRQLPKQSIVLGQRLQPRHSDLASLNIRDVSPAQAAEIDRLYRELLHCARCGIPTGSLQMGSVR
jgi:hypothetical protein